jgi:hypothetical protein
VEKRLQEVLREKQAELKRFVPSKRLDRNEMPIDQEFGEKEAEESK